MAFSYVYFIVLTLGHAYIFPVGPSIPNVSGWDDHETYTPVYCLTEVDEDMGFIRHPESRLGKRR